MDFTKLAALFKLAASVWPAWILSIRALPMMMPSAYLAALLAFSGLSIPKPRPIGSSPACSLTLVKI